jgi:hypothetical protein
MSAPIRDPLIWAKARNALPLPWLMTKLNDGEFSRKGARCPFCEAKGGKWAVFQRAGRYYFKCHAPGCVANDPEHGNTEIGYLVLRKQLSVNEACKEYLRLAVPESVPELFETPGSHKPKQEENTERVPQIPDRDEGAPRNVWHDIWRRVPITIDDIRLLMKKRGFSRYIIDMLGFRSSIPGNRLHLEQLAEEYDLDLLISEGIYKDDGNRAAPAPNGQLAGWGNSGKQDEHGDPIFELNNPIIIPYLDARGVPFHLRPHKGGLSKPKGELEEIELTEDGDPPEKCNSHVYCPFILAELMAQCDGVCVFTEGEFKAAALLQCGIAAISAPGISFVRNSAFRRELIGILRQFHVTDMVICFDNEVKDDPAYPEKYKGNPWERWWTPAYAEYGAIVLDDEYFRSVHGSCRIGMIPDEYRVQGKADFDGVLAQCVEKYGLDQGTEVARKIFLKIIADARKRTSQLEFFNTEARLVIDQLVRLMFHTRKVHSGGDKEMKLARRFAEINPNNNLPVDKQLADLYRSLRGCYYVRKKGKESAEAAVDRETKIAEVNKKIAEHEATLKAGNFQNGGREELLTQIRVLYSIKQALWVHKNGLPKAISDFIMDCKFKLHTAVGQTDRMVKIRNCNEKGVNNSPLVRIGAKSLSRPAEFREWCINTGRAVWKTGQEALDDLMVDLDHTSFMRDIYEINFYGYHDASKLWIFGDAAYGPKGKIILPDENNVFWHDGFGYQIDASVDERGTSFEQGAPLMLTPQGSVDAIEKPDPREIYYRMCDDMFYTIGDLDAWLGVGLMCAYACAPELLRLGGHPGLWMYGLMSGGKTTIARWLMKIWGFKDIGGVAIDDRTTHVGMARFLAQYSCLPVWFDEYRQHSIDPQKEAVIRGSFDRNSGAKGLADHSNRTRSAKIFTTPVITGESGTSDAATRSRFGFVQVSSHRRKGDSTKRYARVQEECRHYYHIGRALMENRDQFAEDMMQELQDWMAADLTKSKISNERVRFVYGTAYAGFNAAAALFKFWERTNITANDFVTFLIGHAEKALRDVTDETFLNQFWQDIIHGIQRGKISRAYFSLSYVKVNTSDNSLTTVNANEPGAIHVCYISAGAAYDSYSKDRAEVRRDTNLSVADLRRQLEKEPYFMPFPTNATRAHRISMGGMRPSCWVINLEHQKPTGTKTEDEMPYLFQYAEDLTDVLSRTEPSGEH